ncbi:DUF2238 domain-containing protein [Arcobacter sp. FWKO B]|uniref:DUF2238 domain-containing protein n=1 Tax=Arcobacter sp. FWKO B TaxID=2593672 RepID=UPI0018A65DDD|nr:DUF2238 domain-containing protein [Arcobacter sp. FWKO B]QOG11252.1 DUF2238 domain-containing protein [Arcobacter sp. FWKO B]
MILDNIKWHNILLYLLIIIFVAVWIWSGIAPYDRGDWILENLLVFIVVILMLGIIKKFRFSTISYIMIVAFLIIHSIGSHYTYALVPYEVWLDECCGWSLNEFMGWERNHFDRLVHFLFGLLCTYPMVEIFARALPQLTKQWCWFFAVQSITAMSVLYELVEWGVAIVFGGELGMHYLGIQGDIWDAHSDMLLAIIGAFLAWFIAYIIEKIK